MKTPENQIRSEHRPFVNLKHLNTKQFEVKILNYSNGQSYVLRTRLTILIPDLFLTIWIPHQFSNQILIVPKF